MSTQVKAIDKRTVHQICSGQVVLSLAIAVKELVENSLDAGATSIEIRLKDHGSELIEVSDNGCGVAPENFEALTLKHHTSKLSEFTDLMSVSTFGFRGEALSSLCALSNLEVTTRQSSQLVATRIEYDSNGHIRSKVSCAREVGTTVTLHHLFHSLPVRHKEFQRNLKKEFSRMVQMLQGYCLICTGKRISCHNQVSKGKKQLVLSTSGGSSLTENIVSVFGQKQLQVLVEVRECEVGEVEEEEMEGVSMDTLHLFKLSGYVSKCCHGYGRSTTDRQYFFFNGRPCDHPKLSKTVNEVYHMYNRHQYPFILLNITTAREHIDVNITPDKRQLILHQEKALLLLVKASLRKIYQSMQGEYEASSVGHTATGDNPTNGGSSPAPSLWKLSSLKRSFSYGSTGEADSGSRTEPKPKQPKLSKFGIKTTAKNERVHVCLQSITPEWEPDSSIEQKRDDDETFLHTTCQGARTGETGNSHTSPNENQFDHMLIHKINQAEQTLPSNHNHRQSHALDDATGGDDETLKITRLEIMTGASPSWQQSPDTGKAVVAVESHERPEKHTSDSLHTQVLLDNIHSDNSEKRQQLSHSLTCDLTTISQRLKGAKNMRKEEEGAGHRRFRAKIRPDSNSAAEEELRREISKPMFSQMKIIGQFNLGFIITRLGSDVFIIDQHATDEKYNFERLQRETVIQNQRLLQPKLLELMAVSESVVMDNIDIFRMNGFHFEVDSTAPPTKRIRLTAQPVSKNWQFGAEDIDELIFLLSDSPGEMVRPSKVRQMFASRACRGSVMIGKALNTAEMKRLVSNMSVLEQPWSCPHGRPTMRHLVDLSRL